MAPLLLHKYHGLGNDYLVCHRSVAEELSSEQIRILCHRHYGVGSDGLLIASGDHENPTLRIINPRCLNSQSEWLGCYLHRLFMHCLVVGARHLQNQTSPRYLISRHELLAGR